MQIPLVVINIFINYLFCDLCYSFDAATQMYNITIRISESFKDENNVLHYREF